MSNTQDLATVIMSEASIGNNDERTAVGSCVRTRMNRKPTDVVRDVWDAFAHNQAPTPEIVTLAGQLLDGTVVDNAHGATHFYSPRSMPKEGGSTTGYDVAGGLELVPPLTVRNYRPGWVLAFTACTVSNARPHYYKFYKAPGAGPVT